ncbi:MAG: site-specific integrase [Nitrospirae bacterium]|nr:site-specific integrase [Nitrospirota bacterium]
MGDRQSRVPDRQGEGPQWHRAVGDYGGRAVVARHLPPWLQEIIVFALVRKCDGGGEILKLQWSYVDLTRRTLTILEQKNDARDMSPVNDTALEVLQARAAVRTSSTDAVFVNGAGHPRNARNLLRAFYTAMRKAGITRFHFHDLQHTFATRLIQAGVDVYKVQKLGRWKTISLVLRCAHHQPESLRGGAEVLDRPRRESSTILAQGGASSSGGMA